MRKKESKNYSLYRRGDVWYVRFLDEITGEYSGAKSTGCTDRDNASAEARRMLEDGEIKPRAEDPLFLDSLVDYWKGKKGLTPRYQRAIIQNIETHVSAFREFQSLRLSRVKSYHINRFIDFLERDIGKPPSMINRIVASLKTFLLYAYSRGYMPKNVVDGRMIEKKKAKRRFRGELIPSEIMKLAALEWPDHRMKCAVMLGCFAGLRRGEVRALRWKDVDFKTGFIYVRQNYTDIKDQNGEPVFFPPKADSSREFPYMIFPELRAAMRRQWEETPFKGPDDLVLPNVWTRNHQNQIPACSHYPLPDVAIKRNFSKMLEAIGISKQEQAERYLSFHSTRHAFTSFMDMTGSSKTTMSLTGHSTREMLENYSHANREAVVDHIRVANEFLDKFRRKA